MRVLLQNALLKEVSPSSWRQGKGMDSFNYGLACIAAVAENAGHQVEVIDTQHKRMTEDQYTKFLKENAYDVVGLTFYTPQVFQAKKTCAFIKKVLPDCKVILGGAHVSSLPKPTMDYILDGDYGVIGEGEITFVELLEVLEKKEELSTVNGIVYRNNGGIKLTPTRSSIKDLDTLPMAAYHLFPMKEYVCSPNVVSRYPTVSFQVSRGCPHRCAFCDYNKTTGRTFRYKSVPLIIEEIKYLRKTYGYRGLVFRDSTLTLSRSFIVELCEAMIKERIDMKWMCYSRTDVKQSRELFFLMKKAGCWQIGFGCESANQKSLDLLHKGTTVQNNLETVTAAYDSGLSVSTTWIICLPNETKEDVLNTISFATKKCPSHIAKFFIPIPYPKTELYDICRENSDIDGIKDDYDRYDMYSNDPVYVNPLIGKEESLKLLKKVYRNFYLNPKVWYRNLKMIKDPDMLVRYFNGIKIMLGL